MGYTIYGDHVTDEDGLKEKNADLLFSVNCSMRGEYRFYEHPEFGDEHELLACVGGVVLPSLGVYDQDTARDAVAQGWWEDFFNDESAAAKCERGEHRAEPKIIGEGYGCGECGADLDPAGGENQPGVSSGDLRGCCESRPTELHVAGCEYGVEWLRETQTDRIAQIQAEIVTAHYALVADLNALQMAGLTDAWCSACARPMADAASLDCGNMDHAGDCVDCGARCSSGGSCGNCDAADFSSFAPDEIVGKWLEHVASAPREIVAGPDEKAWAVDCAVCGEALATINANGTVTAFDEAAELCEGPREVPEPNHEPDDFARNIDDAEDCD